MLAENAEVGLETTQGKGSILEVPEDDRGDDSLYLAYTAEELRWILREAGVIGKDSGIKTPSPYSRGNGMVFTLAKNYDKATHSCVYLMNVMWALGKFGKNDGEYDEKGCVTQAFRRRGAYEAVYAKFWGLPEGRHTYALGLGYELQFGWTWLETYNYAHRIEKGKMRVRKIQIETRPVFKGAEPFIAVFDYDATRRGSELCVSLEVKIPNKQIMYSNGWFHHIQLVQID